MDGSIADFSDITGVDVWSPASMINSTFIDDSYQIAIGASAASPHWIKVILQRKI